MLSFSLNTRLGLTFLFQILLVCLIHTLPAFWIWNGNFFYLCVGLRYWSCVGRFHRDMNWFTHPRMLMLLMRTCTEDIQLLERSKCLRCLRSLSSFGGINDRWFFRKESCSRTSKSSSTSGSCCIKLSWRRRRLSECRPIRKTFNMIAQMSKWIM
jgi:hypothetical protein